MVDENVRNVATKGKNSHTHTKLSCLYLEMPSFGASKAFKDKVTPPTSALCARVGGRRLWEVGDYAAGLSAYYRRMDMAAR